MPTILAISNSQWHVVCPSVANVGVSGDFDGVGAEVGGQDCVNLEQGMDGE